MKLSNSDLDVLYSALLDHLDALEERFTQAKPGGPRSKAIVDEIYHAKDLLDRFEWPA